MALPDRPAIVKALWSRVASVPGVTFTARNPKDPPKPEDMPAILLFELPDTVVDVKRRGTTDKPVYTRELKVAIEVFIVGTTEEAASQELDAFVAQIRATIYEGGATLGFGQGVEIEEEGSTRVLRPVSGDPVAGLGLNVVLRYIEDVSEIS